MNTGEELVRPTSFGELNTGAPYGPTQMVAPSVWQSELFSRAAEVTWAVAIVPDADKYSGCCTAVSIATAGSNVGAHDSKSYR